MSNARICDIDGTIFAEGAEGSQILSGSAMEHNPRTGRVEPVTKNLDVCPRCAGGGATPAPRLAVTGREAAHDVQVVDKTNPDAPDVPLPTMEDLGYAAGRPF